jgi:hypothetical protein
MCQIRRVKTLSEVREQLKGLVPSNISEDVCQLAIAKMQSSTEWLHREFTEEELKNAIRAILKEKGAGYYEFV